MFEWLLRLFGKPSDDVPTPVGSLEPLVAPVPAPQPRVSPVAAPQPPAAPSPAPQPPAEADGPASDAVEPETPAIVEKPLGSLPVPSGTLVFADPRCAPGVVLTKIPCEAVMISATLEEYPSGKTRILGLAIRTGNRPLKGLRRKIGDIAVESGDVVIADRTDYEGHWTEVTQDRLRVLAATTDSGIAAPQPWTFARFEEDAASEFFACRTGHGCGCHKVFVEFDGDHPEGVWIDFEG